MNCVTRRFSRKSCLLACALAAVLVAPIAGAQPVTTVTLQDMNSVALIDVDSSMGMYQWNVGTLNMLSQQWFWYRAGSMTGQQAINTISTAAAVKTGNNILTVNYGNNDYGVRIVYELMGGTSGDSDILESISLFNHTGSDLAFHFFQYSNFDLLGSASGDTVAIDAGTGGYNRARQWKLASQISETITSPSANRAQAGDAAATLADLAGGTYDLNNTTAFGPEGDASWALQWDLVIGANSQADIVKDKRLSLTPIPEPTTLGLIGLGLGVLLLRRRK